MKGQDGYTLVEALAALVMVGLAVGGLMQASRVIRVLFDDGERRRIEIAPEQAAAWRLGQLLWDQGPFHSDDPKGFDGDSQAFQFECGDAVCGATLTSDASGTRLDTRDASGHSVSVFMPRLRHARFVYGGAFSFRERWPSSDANNSFDFLRTLAIVSSTDNSDFPIAQVRLWKEYSPNCRFDPVNGRCELGPRR